MPLTTFVQYKPGTGEIVRAFNDASGSPPTAESGVSTLDVGLRHPIPRGAMHRVSAGVLVARSESDQAAARDAARKVSLERTIGELDAISAAMATRGYSTTTIDDEIAAAVEEHDDL